MTAIDFLDCILDAIGYLGLGLMFLAYAVVKTSWME